MCFVVLLHHPSIAKALAHDISQVGSIYHHFMLKYTVLESFQVHNQRIITWSWSVAHHHILNFPSACPKPWKGHWCWREQTCYVSISSTRLSTPLATPNLFVIKRDKLVCLCVDHKALNNLTIKTKLSMSHYSWGIFEDGPILCIILFNGPHMSPKGMATKSRYSFL